MSDADATRYRWMTNHGGSFGKQRATDDFLHRAGNPPGAPRRTQICGDFLSMGMEAAVSSGARVAASIHQSNRETASGV